MSHATIQDRKLFKQIQYNRRNDKVQGIFDPSARPLKVQDIYNLFIKQEGKCYHSNIPMTMPDVGTSIFQVSMDRVDCSKGHTLDNIVLVCLGINLCRNAFPLDSLHSLLYEVKMNYDENKSSTPKK